MGGLQNTVTNLGASIGTALAGAVLISALSTSFFAGIEADPAIPEELSSKAQVELAGGIPFIPDSDLKPALVAAGIDGPTAEAIVENNARARLDGLRAALSVLALIALGALCISRGIPTRQPGATHRDVRGSRRTLRVRTNATTPTSSAEPDEPQVRIFALARSYSVSEMSPRSRSWASLVSSSACVGMRAVVRT